MNSKKIIKFVLIFMFGMVAFLMSNTRVLAAGRTYICGYGYGKDGYGSIDFYIKNDGDSYTNNMHVYFDQTNSYDCGTEDNPCINNTRFADYSGGLDTSLYNFGFTGIDKSYSCPTLYYKFGETHSFLGKYKRTIKFTWNPNEEHDGVAVGTSYATNTYNDENYDKDKQCSNEQMTKYNNEYKQIYQKLKNRYSEMYNELANSNIISENVEMTSDMMNDNFTYEYNLASRELQELVETTLGCNPGDNNLKRDLKSLDTLTKSWMEKYKNKLLEMLKKDINENGEAYENQLQQVEDKINNEIEETNTTMNNDQRNFINVFGEGNGSDDCEGILGPNVKKDIAEILLWVRIAAPILVIVLGSLDFGKAVLADDSKALSKATSTFAKRMLAAIILFFVPLILNYLIGAIDSFAGGCDIRGL